MKYRLLLACCLFSIAALAQQPKIRVTANGVQLDPSKEMRLAQNDEVLIEISFPGSATAMDMLRTIEGRLCGAVQSTANSNSRVILYPMINKGMSAGRFPNPATGNAIRYSFNAAKLSNCTDAGFYLLFTFKNNSALRQQLFRFFVANERRKSLNKY